MASQSPQKLIQLLIDLHWIYCISGCWGSSYGVGFDLGGERPVGIAMVQPTMCVEKVVMLRDAWKVKVERRELKLVEKS